MATMAYDVRGDGTVSIGRIFSRAFSFAVRNPGITFGSAFLFGALPSVLSQYLTFLQATSVETPSTSATLGVAVLQIILALLSFVLSGLMQAIITRGLVTAHEGGRPSFGQCFAQGLRYTLPVLGLSMLWSIGAGFGFLLLIVPGIILVCMWAVAIPALVEEGTGVFGAFGRSSELTDGHRWKIFGLLMVVVVCFYLLIGLLAVIGISAAGLGNLLETGGEPTIGLLVYSAISGLLFGLLWATIQPSLFVELRDAKEGGGAGELEQVFS